MNIKEITVQKKDSSMNNWPAHIIFDIGGVLYEQISATQVNPLPGLSVLEQCFYKKDAEGNRLHKLYILSNCPVKSFELLTHLFPEFLNYFDGIVLAYQLPFKKPNHKIYQHCLEKFNISAGQAVFIDDVAENVRAAEAAGITGIHHTSADISLRILSTLGIL